MDDGWMKYNDCHSQLKSMLTVVLLCSLSFPDGFGCEMHKKTSRKIWRHLFPHKNTRMMAPVDIPNSAEGKLGFFLIGQLLSAQMSHSV